MKHVYTHDNQQEYEKCVKGRDFRAKACASVPRMRTIHVIPDVWQRHYAQLLVVQFKTQLSHCLETW